MTPHTARRRPYIHLTVLLGALVFLAVLSLVIMATTAQGQETTTTSTSTTTTTEPEPEETTTTVVTLNPSTTVEYLGEDGRPEARETEAHPQPAQPVTASPRYTG
jgi:ABC-type Fe3+-hydroxamate transport system substrate-binding protein